MAFQGIFMRDSKRFTWVRDAQGIGGVWRMLLLDAVWLLGARPSHCSICLYPVPCALVHAVLFVSAVLYAMVSYSNRIFSTRWKRGSQRLLGRCWLRTP